MNFRILVIDDKLENRIALSEIIVQTGADCIFAESGQEALRILSSDQNFALAFVDVHMPAMNGFELATHMRGVEKTKDIPIIFVTANVYSAEYEFSNYDLGAVDFIFKPINVQVLKSKVEVFKRLHLKNISLNQHVNELEFAKKELESSRLKAIEADQSKSAFLANMSHEIRTPITALIGFAELLRNGIRSEDVRNNYLDIIIRSGKHLTEIVNEILDISKNGNVFVDVFSKNETPSQPTIILHIRDTGIGVPKFEQDLLFKPFSQIKNNNPDITPGTGLGLYLSKRLCSLLGGELRLIESKLGHGSTFEMRIPIQDMRENETRVDLIGAFDLIHSNSAALRDIKILIVDDSEDNQILIEAMLKQFGAIISLANNGTEALDKACENDFDVILMDYRMPGLDGLSTTQELRLKKFKNPIILLTANAMKGEQDKAYEAGANSYISKPIDWNVLITEILSLHKKTERLELEV